MLTHSQIWDAIDALAKRHGISTSNLARRAGLDPTTFNRSKRIGVGGHPRWPSTESIAKVLAATGSSVEEFLSIMTSRAQAGRRIPFRVMNASLAETLDQTGHPVAGLWEEIEFPDLPDTPLFALEVRGAAHVPAYRDGTILIAAPDVELRRGDRILVIDKRGAAHIAALDSQSATHLHCTTLAGQPMPAWIIRDLRAVSRIIWASQ